MILDEIAAKLRPWQISPVLHLLSVLPARGAALDASDTGTGKTYVACAVAKSLQLPTLVVCPKIAITPWRRAAEYFEDSFSIINYESLRTGNTPYGSWQRPPLKKEDAEEIFKCECCQCIVNPARCAPCYTNPLGFHCVGVPRKRKHNYGNFSFHPGVGMVVFDEVHRCGGINTLNSSLLISAKRQHIVTLGLSATAAVSPLQLRALGYALGLHSLVPAGGGLGFYDFLSKHGMRRDPQFNGWRWNVGAQRQADIMTKLHNDIIPSRGVRVRTTDIPNFPERTVTAEAYDIDEPSKMDALYAEMSAALDGLDARAALDVAPESALTKILRARQKIELLKVPILVELAEDFLACGRSVGIFCNFRATLVELRARIGGAIIDGKNKPGERDFIINEFQLNRTRLILLNSEAGGVACSLHDLTGEHPRVGLVSPPLSAVTFQQLCGRFHRDGGKSPCFYRVVLAAGTVEERIKRTLDAKLNNLACLNDADFQP